MVQVNLIVENVHLHILPSMNPDGFSLRRRGNANGIDLNRDFPDQVTLLHCWFYFEAIDSSLSLKITSKWFSLDWDISEVDRCILVFYNFIYKF